MSTFLEEIEKLTNARVTNHLAIFKAQKATAEVAFGVQVDWVIFVPSGFVPRMSVQWANMMGETWNGMYDQALKYAALHRVSNYAIEQAKSAYNRLNRVAETYSDRDTDDQNFLINSAPLWDAYNRLALTLDALGAQAPYEYGIAAIADEVKSDVVIAAKKTQAVVQQTLQSARNGLLVAAQWGIVALGIGITGFLIYKENFK